MTRYLPLLFLLACPVMMFFMMRGMRGMGGVAISQMRVMNTGATVEIAPENTDARDKRLADLENEVAEFRASHDRNDVGRGGRIREDATAGRQPGVGSSTGRPYRVAG